MGSKGLNMLNVYTPIQSAEENQPIIVVVQLQNGLVGMGLKESLYNN